jgi:hypothetical protein
MNNSQELGMVWMGYADRNLLDESSNLTAANFYGQTAVTGATLSNNPILDDLTQQTHAMVSFWSFSFRLFPSDLRVLVRLPNLASSFVVAIFEHNRPSNLRIE